MPEQTRSPIVDDGARECLERTLGPRWADGWPTWIDVGDGWLALVADLHHELSCVDQKYALVQVKEKFGGLRFYANPRDDLTDSVRAVFWGVVRRYEDASYDVCERCGVRDDVRYEGPDLVYDDATGRSNQAEYDAARAEWRSRRNVTTEGRGWIRTLCRACRAKP